MKLFANLPVIAAALVSRSRAAASPVTPAAAPGPWSSLLEKLVTGRVRNPISAHYTWVPMNVTTQAVVGGPNMSFYGDTGSINAALLKANPAYKAEDFVSHVVPHDLPSTAVLPPKCNIWPESGSIDLLEQGLQQLNRSGYTVNVPGKSCVALTCINTSSIGLCNDNGQPLDRYVSDMMVYVETLVSYCTSSVGTVNGQIFDYQDFNIVFDSGHCTPVPPGSNFDPPSGGPGDPCGESGSCPMGGGSSGSSPGSGSDGSTTGSDPDPAGPVSATETKKPASATTTSIIVNDQPSPVPSAEAAFEGNSSASKS